MIKSRLAFLHYVVMEMAGCPAYLEKEILATIEEVRKTVSDQDFGCIPDIQEQGRRSSFPLQAIIYRYGTLIKCWENITRAADNVFREDDEV
jgi:hypothetical protein